MADVPGTVPFGIDDLKVEALDGDTPSGTQVDVFGATSISLNTEADMTEARGDNRLVRIRRSNKSVSGSVAMLNHQQAVMAVVSDGESVTSGTTPNEITTYTEPDTSSGKEYQIIAQAADQGGATRLTVLQATTSSGPNFDWSTDSFSEPGWDYEGRGLNGDMWQIEHYETEAAINGA